MIARSMGLILGIGIIAAGVLILAACASPPLANRALGCIRDHYFQHCPEAT